MFVGKSIRTVALHLFQNIQKSTKICVNYDLFPREGETLSFQ